MDHQWCAGATIAIITADSAVHGVTTAVTPAVATIVAVAIAAVFLATLVAVLTVVSNSVAVGTLPLLKSCQLPHS